MDVFLDIGFTLVGGPQPGPRQAIQDLLGLGPKHGPAVTDILFCQDHDSADALVRVLEERFSMTVQHGQRTEIESIWARQVTDAYPLEGAPALVEDLIEANLGLHLVSNIWNPFYQGFQKVFQRFMPFFQTKTLSYREGLRKPSLDFYRRALERADTTPVRAVMVGDSWSKDIAPCLELGLACVQVRTRPSTNKKTGLTEKNRLRIIDSPSQAMGAIKELIEHGNG